MALVKCPECGRGVSDTATACPGCTYPIRSAHQTELFQSRNAVARIAFHAEDLKSYPFPSERVRKARSAKTRLLPVLVLLLLIAVLLFANYDGRFFDQPQYSDSQREAAQGFWDTVIDQYRKLGLIAHYRAEGQNFVIYVRGVQWRLLSYEDKNTFLANVSRTNEILGRTAWVEIRDNDSGIVYGVLNPPLTNAIYE